MLPYAVIAKQVRQEVDITEQPTQSLEAESKISDFEDRMPEIELEQQSLVQKNAKLEDEKKQLQAAKETEVNRQDALIQKLTDRTHGRKHGNHKEASRPKQLPTFIGTIRKWKASTRFARNMTSHR